MTSEQKTVGEMAEAILERRMMLLNLPDKPHAGSDAALLKLALEAAIGASDLAVKVEKSSKMSSRNICADILKIKILKVDWRNG
ncbi:MAG: hypothetical protein H0X30_09660 [Anaerolineae bacterium]|nr:hypothetical protein [Anaerolineae bacterium]